MKIDPIDSRRIRILLSPDDLGALGITLRDLLYGGPALATALRTLLEAARGQAGFRATDHKLLIEAYPTEEGGCVLCFSGLDASPARYRIKSERLAPCLYRFHDADTLCSGCRAVYRELSHRVLRSSLFALPAACTAPRAFLLCVYPLDTPPSRVLMLLDEYARRVGKGRLAEEIAREHTRLVRDGDAIDAVALGEA